MAVIQLGIVVTITSILRCTKATLLNKLLDVQFDVVQR
jgi:hypothetical protein